VTQIQQPTPNAANGGPDISAATLLAALDGPAALRERDGSVRLSNGRYDTLTDTALGRLPALKVGEHTEVTGRDGSLYRIEARPLADGRTLLVGQPLRTTPDTGRNRFLAALSHEMRTPLSGVLGMAGLLADTPLADDQRTYLAAVRESGEHLLSLVNDVLDLAKLDAGKLTLERSPMSVAHLLQSICELLSPKAYAKGIEIAWAAPDAPTQILADEGRLRQILLNLAGNGVKFTDEGGVLINAETQPDDQLAPGRRRLRFTVCDTGPGVPESAREHIFEEFAHAEASHGARIDGTGLGLTIVRRLAAVHDGEVGFASVMGSGSDFWFEAVFETVTEPASQAGPDLPLTGQLISVVSPNAITREAAARQIVAAGGRVQMMASLDEATVLTPTGGTVLIDHALHRMGGPVEPLTDRTCLILVAPEERSAIAPYRLAGFAGYLIKPLRQASIVSRIQALVPSALKKHVDPALLPAVHDERISAKAADGARVLLAEDNPINALLARSLMMQEGCIVERVINGDEAVTAAVSGNYDLIFMDMRMPVMDGLEATSILRTRGVTAPIIALTANAFEEDRQACKAAGMDDFLSKPMDRIALRVALSRWTQPRPVAADPLWTSDPAQAKLAS
jgi:signal transduction histidine kinase/CheY-like chemotaxis protein